MPKQNSCPLEDYELRRLSSWLSLDRGLCYCHVPNEARRSYALAKRLKAQGMSAGVPDILIFNPPPNYPTMSGTAIELKREFGSRVTPAQKAWLKRLNDLGWAARVCHGHRDAIEWLTELGYGEEEQR